MKNGYTMSNKTKTLTALALCTALALVLSYLESLLPPIFMVLPALKIGLPNIVILYVLYTEGIVGAAAVSLVRLVLSSLLFGNVTTAAYSLSGALLSLAVMAVLKRLGVFSPVGVSVAGGIMHNLGQIAVAVILTETVQVAYYMILLTVGGTVAGVLVGLCGALLLRYGSKLRKKR